MKWGVKFSIGLSNTTVISLIFFISMPLYQVLNSQLTRAESFLWLETLRGKHCLYLLCSYSFLVINTHLLSKIES